MALDYPEIYDLSEGLEFEVKKAVGRDGNGQLPDSFWESYSAMANTEGGVILLGVEETADHKFNVVGIVNPQRIIQDLWNLANNPQKISANILHNDDVQVLNVEGKHIVRVRVPRAVRPQRPVFVGINPFRGTYQRRGEGDFLCGEESVKRMLADQVEEARDAKLLDNYGFDDLNLPTFQSYRNAFKSVKQDHPWVDLDDKEFLRNIGGWAKNRETGREGLTIAGLLMFGKLRSILDVLPNFVVDYQERPMDPNDNRRWVDRVTTDGTWSGNLYDFFRTVIQRLTRDLKVPFRLKGATRVDDTPVHEALREALVNTIIHADFTGRLSLLIVKRADMFGFRNPGVMRIPIELAIRGGVSDCRNRNLQKMFQLVGLAEQAGSGLNKVFRNWEGQHWRRPVLYENSEVDATVLRLHMASLLPEETLKELDVRFGPRFRELSKTSRLAIATAAIEGKVTHTRLRQMCADHPRDLSNMLGHLVTDGFLVPDGVGRGTMYYLPDQPPTDEQEDLLSPLRDSQHLESGSQHLGADSQQMGQEGGTPPRKWDELSEVAKPVRDTGKATQAIVEKVILDLCSDQFLSARQLAELLNRQSDSLLNHYLRRMVDEGRLMLLHPEKVNHPQQAYRATQTSPKSD